MPEKEPVRDLVLHGAPPLCDCAGPQVPRISDVAGMAEQTVKRYCRFSDQRDNALAGRALPSTERAIEQARAKAKKNDL